MSKTTQAAFAILLLLNVGAYVLGQQDKEEKKQVPMNAPGTYQAIHSPSHVGRFYVLDTRTGVIRFYAPGNDGQHGTWSQITERFPD